MDVRSRLQLVVKQAALVLRIFPVHNTAVKSLSFSPRLPSGTVQIEFAVRQTKKKCAEETLALGKVFC